MSFQSAVLLSVALLTAVNAQEPVRLPPSIIVARIEPYFYRDGTTVSLPCEAVGIPQPTYNWLRNGVPLSMAGIIPDPTFGTINISHASMDSEGYYQCQATNPSGRTMSDLTLLRVASLPPFADQTNIVTLPVQPNGNLRVHCPDPPSSIPSADPYWSYNTTNMDQTTVALSKRVQIDFNGDLCYASVTSADVAGRLFRCNVVNSVLSTVSYGAHSRIIVSGTTVTSAAPALMFSSPATVVGLQSKQTKLRCFFSGTGVITYTWTYNGASALPAGWIFMDGELSSPATGTAPSDAGTYQCAGSNNLGGASAPTIELVVEAIPDFGSLENQPHDMNVTDGDTIQIMCQPNAVPEATIQWFKDTVLFDHTSLPPRFELSADLMTLTISNVCKDCTDRKTDLMDIQCNASNTHGYSFAQGYVNVLLASTITTEPATFQWAPNAAYKFDCASTCDESTPCTTEWTFEDEPVQEAVVDELGSLHIDTANDTDEGTSRIGTYTCTVSNTYSNTSIIVTLEGEGPVVTTADIWWVGLLVALLVLLLLLLVLICIFCCFCRDSKSYPVDERERQNGNNPVEDLRKLAINEYVPNKSISNGDLPTYLPQQQAQPPAVNVSFTAGDPANNPHVYVDQREVCLPVYSVPTSQPQEVANGSFTAGDPAMNGVYFEDQGNFYVKTYGGPPPVAPRAGPYYVNGVGYQKRPLSHSSQGEVFVGEAPPGVWQPYEYADVPQSEV